MARDTRSSSHSRRTKNKGKRGKKSGPAIPGNWRKWFLAILLVGAVAFAAFHWGDVKKFGQLVTKAEPLWLLAALALQIATYFSLSGEWALVLRAGGSPHSIWRLFPITITKLFADQVVPTAGMSGNVVLVDRLVAIGAPRKNAVAAVILAIVAYYASYAVAALAALVLLWLHSELSWLIIGTLSIFLCVAAAIPATTLWLQKKGQRAMPNWLRKSESAEEFFELVGEAPSKLVRNRRLIAELTVLNGSVFILDALTLQWCLMSLGQTAALGAVFAAFMIASIVMTLGPIPLGLGSFEATSIAMLRVVGVPFEAALSATLLFRGFTLWLPLVAGMILSRKILKEKASGH
jgi:uncharacterized protein (TIRG00374 family)